MLLNCGVGEDSWESIGLQGDPTSLSWRRSVLGVHWKDWCWSWNSNTLATSWEELTHWKRPWCWEGLGAGVEGDDRGWDGWMASPTRWTWVWVNSGSLWWTGRPGVLRFMGSQRVGHDWVTELNWCVWVCMLCYVCNFIICGDLGSHHNQGAELSPPDMVTPSGCTFIIHPTPIPKPWIPLISSPSLQFWECYINGTILCRTFWNCFFLFFFTQHNSKYFLSTSICQVPCQKQWVWIGQISHFSFS